MACSHAESERVQYMPCVHIQRLGGRQHLGTDSVPHELYVDPIGHHQKHHVLQCLAKELTHMQEADAYLLAGLLKSQQGGRSTFPAVKKAFRLLLDNVNDTDPTDIAYTYAGYAPLSIRLVEHALRSSTGESSSKELGLEEALKAIPGPAFDIVQTVDEHGLPVEQSAGAGLLQGQCNATECIQALTFVS